jgi:C4-dicarboxylate-specific signal transduction histidine kinase
MGLLSNRLDDLFRELDQRQETIQLQSHRLVQSVKMASLGEMAAGIAHEVNTPLSVIQCHADLLGKMIACGEQDQTKMQSRIKNISETKVKISKIVLGLRSLSRSGEEEAPQPVSVVQLVEDVLAICSERFGAEGVDLQVDVQTEAVVQSRGPQIGQILLNLLGNAFDAVVGLAHARVQLVVCDTGQEIQFRVTDNGPDIPPVVVERMMQPFFTTKPMGKGTGLGLSISQGLAVAHGGRLYFDTAAAAKTFVLALPKG